MPNIRRGDNCLESVTGAIQNETSETQAEFPLSGDVKINLLVLQNQRKSFRRNLLKRNQNFNVTIFQTALCHRREGEFKMNQSSSVSHWLALYPHDEDMKAESATKNPIRLRSARYAEVKSAFLSQSFVLPHLPGSMTSTTFPPYPYFWSRAWTTTFSMPSVIFTE